VKLQENTYTTNYKFVLKVKKTAPHWIP